MTSITPGAAAPSTASTTPRRDDVPLEPVSDLPTPTPYEPGVGTWLGVGGATLGGGVLGLGIGGGIALMADLNGAFGGGTSGAGMGGLIAAAAAIGAVGGGIWAWHAMQSGHDKREHARVQAEHGTSTLQYARQMMSVYDHDDNGQVDLVNSTGLASMDERVFTEERRQSRSHPKYDWFNDEWRTETERWTETRGTSAARVWTAADVDPRDSVVTDVELARLMSAFDADRNGALTTAEQDAFNAAHPVIVDAWKR
jgi:hypothetical protein